MLRQKRIGKRLKVQVATVILSLTGTRLTKCIVQDISARGAQITVVAPEVVPDFFRLKLETTDEVLSPKCSVRWRTGNEIGVEFLGYGCLHSPALSTTMSTSRPRRSRER